MKLTRVPQIWMAVSQGNDPADGWWFYHVSALDTYGEVMRQTWGEFQQNSTDLRTVYQPGFHGVWIGVINLSSAESGTMSASALGQYTMEETL